LKRKLVSLAAAVNDKNAYTDPGRKIRAGSGRKAPKIAGTWKQYSHGKIFGFFQMISDRFLPESSGN
jgi:hypothetical protein